MATNPIPKISEEQYLAIERAAEFKSEFLDGEMFAMAGTSNTHLLLQTNLIVEVHPAVRDRGCVALGSDSRVKVSSRAYFYPDVSVVCGELVSADEHDDTLLNPVVIFEILSPSTEKYDRGLKFQHYRTLASLRDYILVSQEQIRVEQFTRQPDGTWTFRDYQSLDEQLKIASIGVDIALQRIYDRVAAS
jgi:Uma2 family endonuclease